ncbi:hypothetical protein AB0758_24145 [Tolypothrix bouteillei VB521301_2]|uniref:DUF6960 family protein n=1 Tax=Tolypothrix bouteillei TaxID=1246981 RepID=UPI00051445B7
MSNNVGTWGLYQWFPEYGEDLISDNDIKKFKAFLPNGKVFHCINENRDFLTLQYNEDVYNVKPNLYKKVPIPLFSFGKKVRVINHPDRVGIVRGIEWHFKQNAAIYYLEINGKLSSKRYWHQELSLIGV